MLLVKCEARPSEIHGLGLFAAQDIKAGVAVARWTAGVDYRMTERELAVLPKELREFLWIYVWTGPDGLIYGTADAGRFTNSSKKPNLRWDERTKTSYARKAIAAGTELTEDYDEFDHSETMPVTVEDEIWTFSEHVKVPVDLDTLLSNLKHTLVTRALDAANGNKNKAAQLLGLKRTTLMEYLRRQKSTEE